MLTIQIQQTSALSEETRDMIVQLCSAAHGVDFGQLFSYLPPDGLHLLGYVDVELVSHAVVTTRWLQPEGLHLLRTAYVDAVATKPAWQGQGHGSAILRRLAEEVSDWEIACLETDRVRFYTRLGWEEWRGPLAGRSPQGLIPTPDQHGVLILRLPRTPALSLDILLTIEADGRIW